MTEVEAYSALRETTEYAMAIGEQNITLLTGYLLIAFFIGAKLTRFQVSFVNVLFVVMFLSSCLSLASAAATLTHIAQRLRDTGSDIPMTAFDMGESGMASPIFVLGVCLAMLIGALYFMWSVRHPKIE